MEKKNTVLLTVIAVATLLVAVVGATFAYFTATNATNDNSNGSAAVNTAVVDTVRLNGTAIAGSDNPYYPGTMNYIGTNVTAEVVANSAGTVTTAHDYTVTYTLAGEVTNAVMSASDITWTVYETDAPVAEPVSCSAVANQTVGTEVRYSQTCAITNLTAASAVSKGTGTIAAGNQDDTISITGLTVDTDDANGKYLYLVVELENDTATNQNADQAKLITATITSVTATSTAQK